MSKSELACVYAALMLADDDIDVTADKINTILKAANIKFVESYLPNLFATSLNGKNVKDLLMSMGSPAPSAAVTSAVPTAASATSATAEKPKEAVKEEKKVVSDDDSDESIGFGLFD
uniref:Large ribosomal subunit protein P1 n=1 Tax=Schistosoma japonicum TaxID=6182 RepID=C1LW50_SCHJA|nr:Ribosomal protein LP1 [Schistosoma japonicum]CAX78928.1 Ribosomal protein LP1 [Schistosoma japonicum]CAX78948.1 Ribosomal protein LP1 [Schistosoma japonicum]